MHRVSILVAALSLSVTAHGNDSGSTSYEPTEADRAAMMEGAKRYDVCLHEQSEIMLGKVEDVRAVADAAMKQCESILADLDHTLERNGLAEDFRMGFLRHTKNSSARKLLPELMARRAAEQAPETARQ